MAFRIIKSRDLVRRPWKNGGGTTSEVLVEPPGARSLLLDRLDALVADASPAAIHVGRPAILIELQPR